MSMLSNKPAVGVVIAVVCLVLAGVVVLRPGGASANHTHWVYDLETGDLIASADQGPFPITLDNGHQAVRAMVYACGSCENDHFVGMLERMPEASQQAQRQAAGPGAAPPVTEIAVPIEGKPLQWVVVGSPQSASISNYARSRCAGDDRPVICRL